MTVVRTYLASLILIEPNPILHASVTLSWFEASYGRETLLLMGNAAHDIGAPSIKEETHILEGFVDLRKKNEQLTWMIQFDGVVIGVAWIELLANHGVQPPSVHLMIGHKEYRGKGIGKATMLALIDYAADNIKTTTIHSRHLVMNTVITTMLKDIGFTDDGSSYLDDDGLKWQNVKLDLTTASNKAAVV